ncbi:hypothetical protein L6164_014066 [Bauhinia variegata]|uniref:Uncharacterized protein n=1 Tax=Bauhinia variegata TaxID=167791 RepID=A0ACB9NGQ2_BAUVA|nr:hypothetical protein L6164_014066 [Bauhinia variegata]
MEDDRARPQQEAEDEGGEEDEALSLSDFPLNHNATKYGSLDDMTLKQIHRSSSEASDFFEFLSDFTSSDMRPADDIILCGKLVPFKDQSPPADQNQAQTTTNKHNNNKLPIYRRRSDSLSKLQSSVTRSNSTSSSRHLMMRSSRSLDYERLHRSSSLMISPAPEIERNNSAKSVVVSDMAAKKATKPPWYTLMFGIGIMKVPPEMELNDIRNRQVRRNPSTTMFPANQNSGKGSWKILKALSCKDHTSVSVTTSFPLPQAS